MGNWGRRKLVGADGLAELAVLLDPGAVGTTVGNPLFAGWRAVELPEDVGAERVSCCSRLASCAAAQMRRRCWRSSSRRWRRFWVSDGPDAAAFYGWPEPYPDPSTLAARHAGALELTDHLVAPAFAVLDDDEAGELIALLNGASARVG